MVNEKYQRKEMENRERMRKRIERAFFRPVNVVRFFGNNKQIFQADSRLR